MESWMQRLIVYLFSGISWYSLFFDGNITDGNIFLFVLFQIMALLFVIDFK